MITIHPVCGLIPSTKWKRNRKKGEKSVARTQVYSHGQVRVLECLSELRRKPSRAQSGPTTPESALVSQPGSHVCMAHHTHDMSVPVTCLLPVWQNPRHVGPTDLLLRMSLHAECELSLPWLLHYVLVHLPFWAVLFVWC